MCSFKNNLTFEAFKACMIPESAGFLLYVGDPFDSSETAKGEKFAMRIFDDTRECPLLCVQVLSIARNVVADSPSETRYYQIGTSVDDIIKREMLIETKFRELAALLKD